MKQTLATLRGSFDFILIDSPPAIAVSDAAVVSVASDAVIVVIHAQKTTTTCARRVIECLDSVRAPIIGAILNGVNIRNPDYAYYRRYYGSDYGQFVNNNGRPDNGDMTVRAGKSELAERTPESVELGPGMIPREFLEKIILKLGEAAGPMASVIVREKVADLGESLDAFPKNRLKELFNKLCEEILDEKLRQGFQNSVAAEIRSL